MFSSKLMSTMSKKRLSPPDSVRGMILLNTTLFNTTISVPFVEVEVKHMESAVKCLKPFLLKMKNFNAIETIEEQNKRLIILNPELVSNIEDLTENTDSKKTLQELCRIEQVRFKDIVIGYDNFNHKTILNAVLPEEEDSISSYSQIGHIIHLNLREHNLPFKQLIGQVFLDKVPNCHLVVNKSNTIHNEYRNFEMEVLAKRSEEVTTIVKIKESNCLFEFDFAKVYWNPRLSTEHERVGLKLTKGVDVLYDVFAGVGPFAVPAAKRRKCQVLANDLNPDCYKWLCHNSKLNKVEDKVEAFNMDGRDFISTVIKKDFISRMNNFDGIDMNRKYHVVMNLPALAIEFLDAFKGLIPLSDVLPETLIIPIIHCYCFVKNEPKNGREVVRRMAEEVLGHAITELIEIVNVRKVAPNKDMFRISFLMPQTVLYSDLCANKRQKVN